MSAPTLPFSMAVTGGIEYDTHEPYVEVRVYGFNQYLAAIIKLSVNDARTTGIGFLAAAEASEHTSHVVRAMREQKVAEETVQAVVARLVDTWGKG